MSKGRKRGAAWKRTRELVLARDGRVCVYCGGPATEADHVIPLALGGTDASSNLVAACRTCNAGKGARLTRPARRQPRRRPGW